MRKLSFVILALVGTMILGLPLQSYADPQLDTFLGIAAQARDNLSITISQTNNVSNEIKQLFKQGSNETDQLATAVGQQDVQSAKQHFLAAMKFFKETNDKINSFNTTSNDQQKAEIAQLTSEITRLGSMRTLLMNIAISNNIDVNFAKFDALVLTAQQYLNASNIDGATTAIKDANALLDKTHNSLTLAAQEKSSARALDFAERQIERFSNMTDFNTTSTSPPENLPTPENATGINENSSSVTPSPSTSSPPENLHTSENATGINATSPASKSIIVPAGNNPNITTEQNPKEMISELKKLVSEGKIDEALKVIKMLEAYQREKPRAIGHEVQQSPPTVPTNATGINETSLTVPTTPNKTGTTPPTTPPNKTGTTPTTPPNNTGTTQSNSTNSGHDKHNNSGKHNQRNNWGYYQEND